MNQALNDTRILATMRSLLAADKPKTTTPLDLLQTIRLLLQHADEKDVYVSQITLAEELCSSPDAIARSQKRLSKRGWLSVSKGGYRGRANRYAVMLNKLPVGDLTKTVVSEDAQHLAKEYYKHLILGRHRKKLPKKWVQHSAFTIQRLIDRTGGDDKRVTAIFNFALKDSRFMGRARKGPHELRQHWRTLVLDFDEAQARKAQPTPEQQAQQELDRQIDAEIENG